jgi:site-specific DNA-cytosine methylase
MLILDLCGGTGSWSKPYREAGYQVEVIDPKVGTGDVRLLQRIPVGVHGILAAPPCTDLAGSGARWWAEKGEDALRDALSMVDACIRIAWVQQPQWWALENPVGRLSWFLGPPQMTFDPADYGDPYTKKTLLWGRFNPPVKRPVEAVEGSKMHLIPPSPERQALRSVTPEGFARAFFEANP